LNAKRFSSDHTYVYRDAVDMRKQTDGLSALVATELVRSPLDGSLYVFINRSEDKVKLLIWHVNGYWMLYKRLEKQRFKWPGWFEDVSLELTVEQLDYLLDGYDLNGMRSHQPVHFEVMF